MDEKQDNIQLGGTKLDVGVSLLKGGVGAIPFAGPILAEIIGQLIPQQRIQRLEDYMRRLNERFDEQTTTGEQRARLGMPEWIDLFEEGAVQSARAISDERRQHIANVVAHGLSGDDKARIEAKRLLKLLGEIDDDQIIVLSSYLRRNSQDKEFQKKHEAILRPVGAYIGSSHDEVDRETLYRLARQQLMRLGLLADHFKQPKKGEFPEFDLKTGMMKSSRRDLTSLGRLLLTRIGIAEQGEF